jgi:hypothetical protein
VADPEVVAVVVVVAVAVGLAATETTAGEAADAISGESSATGTSDAFGRGSPMRGYRTSRVPGPFALCRGPKEPWSRSWRTQRRWGAGAARKTLTMLQCRASNPRP